MSEWKEYKLGEIAEIITGYPFPGDKYESTGNLRVVRGENVTIGNLRWDTEKHWNHETGGLEKYFLQSGDIVIGMDGSRVGDNRAKVKQVDLPLILAQRVACLRAKKEFSQDYLWYTIFSDNFKKYIEAIHTGTSIPHISQKQIEDFEILCPPLDTQRRIASILTSLDDKIDLLRRENATLEQMAETLFRQWFVVEAKEEWKEVALGDVVKTTSGGTPSRKHSDYYENGTINWVKSKELDGSFISSTEELITEEAVTNSSAKMLPEKSVLIAMYGATVGEYGILSKPMSCNQAVCALIPNENYPYTYLYVWTALMKEDFINLASGAAQQNISQDLIKQQIVCSDLDKIKQYDEMVRGYFEKMENNQKQIITLTETRDGLLGRLMSGELKV